jgi:hypothetical protein
MIDDWRFIDDSRLLNCAIRLTIGALTIGGSEEMTIDDCGHGQSAIAIASIHQCRIAAIPNRMLQLPIANRE